jgi:predicted nucleotidyltransferase
MSQRPLPPEHARFLERALPILRADARLIGVAAGGSYAEGSMDEWSDLDLLIVVEPASYEAVMADRKAIAGRLGPLLEAFTGEHVNEPRLVICLYGPPLLHVDLKFVVPADLSKRVEDPVVLWERDGRFTTALATGAASFPKPDLPWIEARWWTWIHYVAVKIGRGELFEALGCFAFFRERVLGPMALEAARQRPQGIRKIERRVPTAVAPLKATLGAYDARVCLDALRACVALYRDLRHRLTGGHHVPGAVELEAVAFLDHVATRLR